MKVMYINTVFEDYDSSKSAYILLWFFAANGNDDKTKSTSSQIVEQIEVFQK